MYWIQFYYLIDQIKINMNMQNQLSYTRKRQKVFLEMAITDLDRGSGP